MKKHELPPASDPLLNLLDDWQPAPDTAPGFEARLQRRIQRHLASGPRRRRWAGWAALWPPRFAPLPVALASLSAAALLSLGVFFYMSAGQPAPAASAPAVEVAQMSPQMNPMFRDLQTLDRDSDLLENLNFLSVSGSAAAAGPRIQDQD